LGGGNNQPTEGQGQMNNILLYEIGMYYADRRQNTQIELIILKKSRSSTDHWLGLLVTG
jgi:hypothetical protein